MPQNRTLVLLFGAAAGIAIGAILIGLALVAIAIAAHMQADASSLLMQHPLFISGCQLVVGALLASLPLFVLGNILRKQ